MYKSIGETMSFDLETIDIEGYNGKNITNKFLKQKSGSGPLSVILPGLRYNVDMPILYYTTGILLAAGHSVLSVDIRYSEIQEFMSGSSQERTKWMFKDAEAIFNTIQRLEGHNLSVLAGKSLGTILMSYMLQNNQDIQECKTLWLTPLLHHNMVIDQIIAHKGKSLVVIGTADSFYSDDKIARLVEEGKCEVMVIPRGNHSLDVPGGVLESMKQLSSIMGSFKEFIQ
ncbi:MAG: hypothetical protein ACTSQZ_03135 [Candidatus Thorarchaeota archaeon]